MFDDEELISDEFLTEILDAFELLLEHSNTQAEKQLLCELVVTLRDTVEFTD